MSQQLLTEAQIRAIAGKDYVERKPKKISLRMKFLVWLYQISEPVFFKLRFHAGRELHRIWQAEQVSKALTNLENFRKDYPDRYEKIAKKFSDLRQKGGCKHLKGGDKIRGPWKDYSVRQHTFPDGTTNIKCTICGTLWTKDSPNWLEARKMVEQSTNTPSSSEIIFDSPLPIKVNDVKTVYRWVP